MPLYLSRLTTRFAAVGVSLAWALLATVTSLPAAEPAAPRVQLSAGQRTFLLTHCRQCHNQEQQEARFRVDDLPLIIADLPTAERWQKVLNALNSGEMPPADEPQPAADAKADFLDELATRMVDARKALADRQGAVTIRRLNRREYRNTLRELLGVEISVSELPADVGSGGFDTVGVNLFMSSNQFEQYLALGREALDEAFERHAARDVEKRFRLEGEETTVRIRQFVADTFDAHERGKQWIAAVEAAATRPENAAVVAEIRKTAKDDAIFRRSWEKIAAAPSPESFGFNTGENNADKANRAAGNVNSFPYYQYYLKQPELERGGYLTIGIGNDLNSHIPLLVPFGWPVGEYRVRLRVAATSDAAPERRYLEFGINPRHGQVMSTHHVTGTMDSPQIIEIPLTLTRGHQERSNRTLFIREKGTADHFTQTRRRFDEGKRRNGFGPTVALWVDWFEVERVPDTNKPLAPGMMAVAQVLATKGEPERALLKEALRRFASEAFRGAAPEDSYLDRLLAVYAGSRQLGRKHDDAFRETLAVVLASPRFLYLAEPTTDGQRRRLTGAELAVRLSYFLGGTPPDVRLRELGRSGELLKPEVLASETDRLLNDPRASGFTRPFVEQWLGLERLDFFEINRELHPRFDDATKLAARNEVYATVDRLFQENGKLSDLLKADYVVVNSVLAGYYGMEGVSGDEFRRVPLPPESPRGGLLGMAAVSVMGGNGERSSPIERGAWVLRKLLHDPPPPAPANVPLIARLADRALTTRERLAAHQEQAQCASCHRKIDPIGLGLENFDAVGQWRTEDSYMLVNDNGKPDPKTKKVWTIDPAGAFHGGSRFRDYFELRDQIAARGDDFARGFNAALIEYALGRPVEFSDDRLLDAMTARAHHQQGAVRGYVHALIASEAFHTK
jgi:mono/diheme cytochrome c family protein